MIRLNKNKNKLLNDKISGKIKIFLESIITCKNF